MRIVEGGRNTKKRSSIIDLEEIITPRRDLQE